MLFMTAQTRLLFNLMARSFALLFGLAIS
jgi:hypothetical protein